MKHFKMDKVDILNTMLDHWMWKMIHIALTKMKRFLSLKYYYLSVIETLMYFANFIRLDISFITNLLVIFSLCPARDIGMRSKIYFDIFEKQLIWVCFISNDWYMGWLAMQIQAICQTYTKPDLKHDGFICGGTTIS